MHDDDLQIGATSTARAEAGKGLATHALIGAVHQHCDGKRSFWYLCDADNSASRRVANKAGFKIVGTGEKRPRFGLLALGYYVITSQHESGAQ